MKKTLLIMAAGLGSRYGGGGAKQVDHMGPNGEILMEYSIYDAMAAGFDKVVFVIKRSMEAAFRAQVGDKIARKVEVHYAFQVMAASLERMAGEERSASMVAYYLRNTVSENGDVTRGVCEKDGSSLLTKVTETYGIKPCADGTIRSFAEDPAGVILPADALVSMNFWGFTPWLFAQGEEALAAFLRAPGDEMKKEYPLPLLVDTLMHEKGLRVEVLSTAAVWFGVTNPQDKAQVMAELRKLHDAGSYPPALD